MSSPSTSRRSVPSGSLSAGHFMAKLRGLKSLRLARTVHGNLLLLMLVVLVPLVVAAASIQYRRTEARRSDELQANLELARAVGVGFEAFVGDVLHQEQDIANCMTLPDRGTPENANQLLAERAEQYPFLAHYSWVDPGGRVLASSKPEAVGIDISHRSYFHEIEHGGEWVVSDLLLGLMSPQPVVVIARSASDEAGRLLGIVVAGFDPRRLGEVLPVTRAGQGGIALIDRRGRDVYRNVGSEAAQAETEWTNPLELIAPVLAGQEVSGAYRPQPDAEERLAGFAPVRSLGWVAEASRPASEALAPAARGLYDSGWLTLAGLLGVSLAALLMSRRVAIPILRLREYAAAIGRGDYGRRAEIKGPVELIQLAAAFDRMAEEMHSREEGQARLLEEVQQANARLRESEERYRSLFETALDAILLVAEDGAIIDANPQASVLTGYLREELLQLSIYDLLPPILRKRARRTIDGFSWEGPLRGDYLLLRKDGQLVDVEFRATRVGSGRYQAVFHDVSERKRSEAERERLLAEVQRRAAELDAAIASIVDGFIIYNRKGEIVYMNAAAADMLGYSAVDRERRLAERLARLRVETAEGKPMALEEMPVPRALCGETVRNLVNVIHSTSGKTLWLSSSAAPIRSPDGGLLGAVSTFTDITAQRELQEQREDLVRAVSHDLRGPLTIVQGQAELLLRGLRRGGLTGREEQGLETVITAARRMNAMIQDLVDSARLESGQLELSRKPLDLCSFVLDLKERLVGVVDPNRIRVVSPERLPLVSGDANRVERILVNLLSNASKYSPPASEVTITLAAGEHEVVISVADRGQGIGPEELPHLFGRYYRTHVARQRPNGLGLGLYITRMLVEAHGGRIWVESKVGQGSTFHFSLPLA